LFRDNIPFMESLRFLFLLVVGLPFLAPAQSVEPDPVPKFRFGIPIPQVAGHRVKKVVFINYKTWLQDSLNISRSTFQLGKTGKKEVVFEYLPDGRLTRAVKIFPYGEKINADWEQVYLYDSLARLAYIRARYVGHVDGAYVYPDSTAYQYDEEGRLIEIIELENYRFHENRVAKENGLRTRYTYLPGGRVVAREKCRTKTEDIDEMKCGVDSMDFDSDGKIIQIRWIKDAYKDSLGNYPPEITFEYDATGKLRTLREYEFGTEFFRTIYEYDAQGRVISETRTESRVATGNAEFLRFHYRADGLPDRVISGATGRGSSKFDYKILYDFY
jgi:hypothetical protein